MYAYQNLTDSLKATTDFNIKLIRKRLLNPFDLVSPPNNTVLEVKSKGTATINIDWNNVANATQYYWLAKTVTGNFNNPLLRVKSNNNGAANSLTFREGALDTILAENGLNIGDSIALQWTVVALEPEDTLLANQTNQITLIRTKNTGMSQYDLSKMVNIYPNPASQFVKVETNKLFGDGTIELVDLTGRVIISSTFYNQQNNTELNLTEVKKGMYIIRVTSQVGIANVKLMIH